MDDKDLKQPMATEEEKVLDFEIAKDLTVGEAVKKHQEIQVGITEDDGVLDRYIKQHRQDIESKKFETPTPSQETVEVTNLESEGIQEPVETALSTDIHSPVPSSVVEDEPLSPPVAVEELGLVRIDDEEDKEEKRKKIFIWAALGLAFLGVLVTAFIWLNQQQQSVATNSSTSTTSSSQETGTSSSEDPNAVAFKQLYESFFTDSSLTKLKNSEFGKLAELKTLLDKLDKKSDAYQSAKEQYDHLAKAIEAVQSLNEQFDKPVVVDGEIDTSATAKPDSDLTAVTTGLSSVDSLLASAVNFGRSQTESASSQASPAPTAPVSQPVNEVAAPSSNQPVVGETSSQEVTGSASRYGIPVPAGVTLQRHLSRVPYDQSKIDDTANASWTFGEGILENILSISRQRGYITGDQFILEKVNIINGNGYYNLFKPDGTYLFSINCKTGYFVGNGAGHSDALDY